jgi:hypothetical protein
MNTRTAANRLRRSGTGQWKGVLGTAREMSDGSWWCTLWVGGSYTVLSSAIAPDRIAACEYLRHDGRTGRIFFLRAQLR